MTDEGWIGIVEKGRATRRLTTQAKEQAAADEVVGELWTCG